MKRCSVTQRREVKLIFSANSIQWKPGRERTRAQVGVGTSARRGRASGSGVRFGGCKINKLASGFLFVFPPPPSLHSLALSLCFVFLRGQLSRPQRFLPSVRNAIPRGSSSGSHRDEKRRRRKTAAAFKRVSLSPGECVPVSLYTSPSYSSTRKTPAALKRNITIIAPNSLAI